MDRLEVSHTTLKQYLFRFYISAIEKFNSEKSSSMTFLRVYVLIDPEVFLFSEESASTKDNLK